MIGKTAPFIIASLIFCGAEHASVRAQESRPALEAPASSSQTSAAQAGASSSSATEADADLSITANVTARELRFETVPDPKVEFTGKPERKTSWEAERQNLPRPVEPGVTYRNIGIQLKITSVFADIDRIVAEALGEVPPRDAAPPAQTATPSQPAPAQPTSQPPSQPKSEGNPR